MWIVDLEVLLTCMYFKSGQVLGNANPPLTFEHVLRCKFMVEPTFDSDNVGFRSRQECVKTMNELREWAGFKPFEQDQIAEIKRIGLNDALKCRWMRKDPEWTLNEWRKKSKTCLRKIIKQRSLFKFRKFNLSELNQIYEPFYINDLKFEPLVSKSYWNDTLFESNENYYNLKNWLDKGGNVFAKDR